MGLNLPRRKKRRLPDRPRQLLDAPEAANAIWPLAFMSDALYGGRRFRTLNILDDGVREALRIVIGTSIPGSRSTDLYDFLSGGQRGQNLGHEWSHPRFENSIGSVSDPCPHDLGCMR
jgi:hypothetical protein